MNEWGLPISKDKIIARRNRLIEYQKLGELRFTPLYEAIDENILDINYMLHEIENLQSKIDKAIEYINKHFQDDEGIVCKITGEYEAEINEKFIKELLSILKEDK